MPDQPGLVVSLSASADLGDDGLGGVFGDLADQVLGVDLTTTVVDTDGVTSLTASVATPDLAGLRDAVGGTLASGALATGTTGIPGAVVPGAVGDLLGRLGSLGTSLGPLLAPGAVPDGVGLDVLASRLDAVDALVGSGPVADLVGLVPGLSWTDTLGRVTGDAGGAIALLRVLAGLLGTASVTRHLTSASERLATMLDAPGAATAGEALRLAVADTSLAADLRGADPEDPEQVAALSARVVALVDAVAGVAASWSQGMGYGEASLGHLDLVGDGVALEVARAALSDVDLAATAAAVLRLTGFAQPLLQLDLPALPGSGQPEGPGRLLTEATSAVRSATTSVAAYDVEAALAPVTDLAALALAPVRSIQQGVGAVAAEVTGALGGLRGLVSEIDLHPVADAVDAALRPVTDLLEAVEREVGAVEDALGGVAHEITTALGQVADLVEGVRHDVDEALGAVRQGLAGLHLDDLAHELEDGLHRVAAALATAQLTPYFDTAIDVISTSADVIELVPFGMLPTDVQQEIVDVCRPIKQLDLGAVEDTLRGELTTIRTEFRADALEAIEEAYAAVVDFLASLDPQPHLEALETETFTQLRSALDEVDPTALLAPVQEVIDEVRGALDGFDLGAEVLDPLRELFAPVLEAIDALDPAALLQPVVDEVDRLRGEVLGALHLDVALDAVDALESAVAGALDRVDARGLVDVLDARALDAVAALPTGPPGGALGAVLTSVAEASGFRADEDAVSDVLTWVRGADGVVPGDVVRQRVTRAATVVGGVRDAVRALDPDPLTPAAGAQHQALAAALAVHPEGSALRLSLDDVLAGPSPAALLGPLAANRRRYLDQLEVHVRALEVLAASGRSEVTAAASGLHVAVAPLDALVTRLREVLAAVGILTDGRRWQDVLVDLLKAAHDEPDGLMDAFVDLVDAVVTLARTAAHVLTQTARDAIGSVTDLLDLLDLSPVLDELTALHQQVRDEVVSVSPEALLGPALERADAVRERLADFDPLAPVRQVVDEALATADQVFDTARPTVVFAQVVALHGDLMRLASGLDVVSLLRPVLDALDGIAAQLDDGFDRTGDALVELQDALPGSVGSGASVGVSVSGGLGL